MGNESKKEDEKTILLRKNLTRMKGQKTKDIHFIEYERVCKFCHMVLMLIVRRNRSSIKIISDINILDLMLEQISTPWDLCLKDIFKEIDEE